MDLNQKTNKNLNDSPEQVQNLVAAVVKIKQQYPHDLAQQKAMSLPLIQAAVTATPDIENLISLHANLMNENFNFIKEQTTWHKVVGTFLHMIKIFIVEDKIINEDHEGLEARLAQLSYLLNQLKTFILADDDNLELLEIITGFIQSLNDDPHFRHTWLKFFADEQKHLNLDLVLQHRKSFCETYSTNEPMFDDLRYYQAAVTYYKLTHSDDNIPNSIKLIGTQAILSVCNQAHTHAELDRIEDYLSREFFNILHPHTIPNFNTTTTEKSFEMTQWNDIILAIKNARARLSTQNLNAIS